ncbi:baseplate J/gp47 family protein [Frigidibacter sp. SD6-1]|uniref:baseplate J/gp47 family protein n=1 Tax=Frigidibacter sp. SD6-1 TaxID=3032581 RepID=UPI0024DF6E9E|nr:baseplate J/gp47 family protein [Frigidibacter sp. SD6-1]
MKMRDDAPLDSRRFADLVAEAKEIIAARCPGWTDLNPGDPGMTLVEVYAWLTETMLYRLNRLPERMHAELLKLLGVSPMAPAAAVVMLRFTREGDERPEVELPQGLHVSDASGKITFVTLAPVQFAKGAAEAEVLAVNAEIVAAEVIGTGNGDGGQSFAVRRAPVLRPLGAAEELRVGVEWQGGDLPAEARTVTADGRTFLLWDEVENFAGRTAARAYVADRGAGRITFAPATGAARALTATLADVPPAAAQIRAWYMTGGGRAGNVAPGTLTQLRERLPAITVTNPARAAGGEDGETVAAFLARGRDAVRNLECAVTADDFTQAALSAGGVARAKAYAEREAWIFGRHGVVEVLAVPAVAPDPDSGAVTADALAAGRTEPLRDRIRMTIDVRRPIGVRTEVKWAKCLPLAISGRIAAAPSEDLAAVERRVTRRLNALVSPLGDWPFGKTLRVSDVYEAILDDPGVRYTEQLTLTTELGPEGDTARLFTDPHQPRCLYALMADGLYRSLDYATSWERVLAWPDARPMAIAADPDQPGFLAVVGLTADGQSRLVVSQSCGEAWEELERIQHQVNDLAVTVHDSRRWLLIAAKNGLFRTDRDGPRGILPVKVDGGAADQGGFYAVATGTSQSGQRFAALAARGKAGVWLSSAAGAPGTYQLLPGSQGQDIRAVEFVRDGGQLWLWASIWTEGGELGKGMMRISVRADGLDPKGWTVLSKGWKGGSCLSFAVAGNRVAAGTRDGGVLILDASAADPAWTAPLLTSGLPIDADRARLLPVDAVALGQGDLPLLLAGTEQGLFRGDAEGLSFHAVGGRRFTDRAPLPPGWLYCAGEHRLSFMSDLQAKKEAADARG